MGVQLQLFVVGRLCCMRLNQVNLVSHDSRIIMLEV